MNISDTKVGDCQLPPVSVMPIAKTKAEHSIHQYIMTSKETRGRLQDWSTDEGDETLLNPLSKAQEQDSIKPVTKRTGVPLRMRQLPASFWREPNRPKADLITPISSLTLAYLGQCYNNDRFHYTNYGSTDLPYRPVLPSSVALGNQNESMSDYLYRNYAAKYHRSIEKSSDVPWNCAPFPETRNKQFSHSHSGLTANPYSLNPTSQRMSVVPRCGEFRSYPVSRSDLPPGHWEGLTLGQYPVHSSQQTLSPWRPIASKTSPSYPARYHPFVV